MLVTSSDFGFGICSKDKYGGFYYQGIMSVMGKVKH
jgi:hypothetical protein